MSQEVSSLKIILVVGLIVVSRQFVQGSPLAEPRDRPTTTGVARCTSDSRLGVVEFNRPSQQFSIIPSINFKYVQISMKIKSCFSNDIYRGNRFLTRKVLKENSSPGTMGIPLTVSYRTVNGSHSYRLTVDAESVDYSRVFNTGIMCGRYHGFKVKAVGATVCVAAQTQNDMGPASASISSSSGETDMSKTIDDLHRWATAAHVMAIWFTLTVYGAFLIGQMCQKKIDFFLGNRIQSHEVVQSQDVMSSS